MQATELKTKEHYIQGYKTLQSEWKAKDKELLFTGRLAYWTYWISKQAEKTNNPEERVTLFNLKRNGILLLSKSNYAQVRKYVPNHHKKLCYFHYLKMKKSRMNPHKFLFLNENLFEDCSECQKGKEHYFSLYSLAILNEIEDIEGRKPLFIMYSPYLDLKEEFPNIDSVENVKRYYGTELCTVDHDKKISNLDVEPFSIELIIKYFTKNYNALSEYLLQRAKS